MKDPKILFVSLFLFVSSSLFLNAQEALTAAGGDASGSGGSVSYSVGQVAYVTNSSTDFSEAQGVQQPYEISIITNTVELDGQTIQALLFPNPSIDQLTLSIDGIVPDQLTYELYDLQGRLLVTNPLTGNKTEIIVSHLAPATYLLKVTRGQQTITHFKILKN